MNLFILTDDILDIIFNQLTLDEMIIFYQVNSHTYNTFKDVIKNKAKIYLNKDYKKFRDVIVRYNYCNEELLEMGLIAVKGINQVAPFLKYKHLKTYKYYDLRYLFELILLGLDIDDEHFIDESRKNSVRFETQIEMMLKSIKNSISFNRFETIHNINKKPEMLGVLHRSFRANDKEWVYI
jgi:hypothetical protein